MKSFSVSCVFITLYFLNFCFGNSLFCGSVLWNKGKDLNCLQKIDEALIVAMAGINDLLPVAQIEVLRNESTVNFLLDYFEGVQAKIQTHDEKMLLYKAFYDAIGGFFKSTLIPNTKLSFYAGNMSLSSSERVMKFYSHCKHVLDTAGHGWKEMNYEKVSYFVSPIYLDGNNESCNVLEVLDDKNENNEEWKRNELIAMPKLEPYSESGLGNIWLPFRHRQIHSLRTRISAFVLIRYFMAASKCYKDYQMSTMDFEKKMSVWIENNLIGHLRDEELYAGLGGILRIMKFLELSTDNQQRYKFSTDQKRNLSTTEDELKDFDLLGNKNQILSHIVLWILIIIPLVTIIIIVILCWFTMKQNQKGRNNKNNREEPFKRKSFLKKNNSTLSERSSFHNKPQDFVRPITTFGYEKKSRGETNFQLNSESESEEEILNKTRKSLKSHKISQEKITNPLLVNLYR